MFRKKYDEIRSKRQLQDERIKGLKVSLAICRRKSADINENQST